MSDFEDIRDIVYQKTPNAELWGRLTQALESWEGKEPLDVVLSYCQDHMASWPMDLATFAPKGFFQRSVATIEADPLTPFYVHAAQSRTGHFRAEAEGLVTAQRASKPAAFLNLDEMGEMRWREGEALDEKATKQLIALFKARGKAPGDTDLLRLRQFLDDRDCQRWSLSIHKAWVAAGSKSPHKWALHQVACLGKASDIPCTASNILKLSTSSKSARAKQIILMMASLDNREANTCLVEVAMGMPMRYVARSTALYSLKQAAERRGMDLLTFLEKGTDLHAHKTREEAKLVQRSRTSRALDKADEEKLNTALEHAMLSERAFPLTELNEGLLSTPPTHALLTPLVWRTAEGVCFRFGDEGPIEVGGSMLKLDPKAIVRLAHPIHMSGDEVEAWRTHLEGAGVTPGFVQLDRPLFDKTAPVITEKIPVEDRLFFLNAGWSLGAEIGGGFVYSTRLIPKGVQWFVDVDFSYGVHVGEYEFLSRHQPEVDEIEGFQLRCKLGNAVDWANDPLAYSEASALVAKLLEYVKPEAPQST